MLKYQFIYIHLDIYNFSNLYIYINIEVCVFLAQVTTQALFPKSTNLKLGRR